MDWCKGKSTGNHGFLPSNKGFPVNVPVIQFYEMKDFPLPRLITRGYYEAHAFFLDNDINS